MHLFFFFIAAIALLGGGCFVADRPGRTSPFPTIIFVIILLLILRVVVEFTGPLIE